MSDKNTRIMDESAKYYAALELTRRAVPYLVEMDVENAPDEDLKLLIALDDLLVAHQFRIEARHGVV